MRRLVFLAPCLAWAVPAAATELYSWHSVDATAAKSGHFELIVSQRIRTRRELHYFDQERAGAVLRYSATKRLIPFAGAYYQPQQVRAGEWIHGRRLFGGVEAPFRNLTTRLAVERYFGTGRPDYTRFRSYARLLLGGGRLAPYLQNEWLAVPQGFHSVRNSGGLRMRVTPEFTLEAGYLYDLRRTAWGGDRQAIVTAIRWQPKIR